MNKSCSVTQNMQRESAVENAAVSGFVSILELNTLTHMQRFLFLHLVMNFRNEQISKVTVFIFIIIT